MENLTFTPEQLEAAKTAKSPEELVTKAKEQGIEITPERAAAFLAPQKEGELSDDELENVAGGWCRDDRGREVVTLITFCMQGLKYNYHGSHGDDAVTITCGNVDRHLHKYTKTPGEPGKCRFLSYEKGIWYCNYSVMPH